jgi:hypothetical protein
MMKFERVPRAAPLTAIDSAQQDRPPLPIALAGIRQRRAQLRHQR